ncbi:MAG: hypothetical protein Q9186_005473 [Xanthomendoza sp. 1 TL-2023]
MIHAKSTAALAHAGDVRELAMTIRKAIRSMHAHTIPVFLHEVAHHVDAQRFWQLFGGQHHVMVTSWLDHRICEVDFGAGKRPRLVEGLMAGWIIQLMESRYDDRLDEDGQLLDDDDLESDNGHDQDRKAGKTKKERPWYSTGVDVSLNLEAKVVERLLQKPLWHN